MLQTCTGSALMTPWLFWTLGTLGSVMLTAGGWLYFQALKKLPWLNFFVAVVGLTILVLEPLDAVQGHLADAAATQLQLCFAVTALMVGGIGMLMLSAAGGIVLARYRRQEATRRRLWAYVAEREAA